MGLQCDPTVIYALERAGRYDGNITRDDLQLRLALQHLPLRGPAARPDRRARPRVARGGRRARPTCPYLYFVSRNDGSHAFASTLDEHNRNVQQYQVQYFRDRREQSRRQRP